MLFILYCQLFNTIFDHQHISTSKIKVQLGIFESRPLLFENKYGSRKGKEEKPWFSCTDDLQREMPVSISAV